MNTPSPISWRFRIGFLLSTFLGFAWGILLGWYQVRLNAYRSPAMTLLVTMPIAFWGSLGTGFAFQRMLPGWHTLARWLVATVSIIAGLPWGIIWALLGDGVDPFNLLRSTGWTPWQLEWAIALVGVLGGLFPRWMLLFLRPLGKMVLGILARPLNALRWLRDTVLGLPQRWMRFLTNAAPRSMPPPPPLIEPVQPPRTRRARPRRVKARAKPAPVPSNGNHNGARVIARVEDRCPYCFDVVKRNDPRGVHVCHICHTPHHADCWAITGKCQVPHLNT